MYVIYNMQILAGFCQNISFIYWLYHVTNAVMFH